MQGGDLPVSSLFNSKEVVIGKHNQDGTYEVNGDTYTAEQWESIRDNSITCLVFKRFSNGTYELEANDPKPSWYDRNGSAWGWGHPFVQKENEANVKQKQAKPLKQNESLRLETVHEAKDKTVYTYKKPEQKPSEPVKTEPEPEESETIKSRQERLREIRETWTWQDVPFHSWLNRLGRR